MKKKIVSIMILLIFLTSNIFGYFPLKVSNAGTSDDKNTLAELISDEEGKRVQSPDSIDDFESNSSVFYADGCSSYTEIVNAQNGTHHKLNKNYDDYDTKLVYSGSKDPNKYIAEKYPAYSHFTPNVSKEKAKKLEYSTSDGHHKPINYNKMLEYQGGTYSNQTGFRAVIEALKNKKTVDNVAFVSGNKGKSKDEDAFIGLGCTYKKIGTWNGKYVDMYMEISDVKFSSETTVNHLYSLAFADGAAGIYTSGLDSVLVEYMFTYTDGTSVTPKGFAQLYDIDSQQGVKFNGSSIKNVIYSSDVNGHESASYKNSHVNDSSWPYLYFSKAFKNPYIFAPGGGQTGYNEDSGSKKWKTGVAMTFSGDFQLELTFAQSNANGQGKKDGANGYQALDAQPLGVTDRLKIKKVDAAGNPLSGVKFQVNYQNEEGEYVSKTYTTDASGLISKDIPALENEATVWEVEAPNGYTLDTNIYWIDFTGKKVYYANVDGGIMKKGSEVSNKIGSVSSSSDTYTASLNITNKKVEGLNVKVKAKKKDKKTGEYITGGVYTVKSVTGATTDGNSTFSINEPSGTFSSLYKVNDTATTVTMTVEETTPPTGYLDPDGSAEEPKEHRLVFTKSGNTITSVTVDGNSVTPQTDPNDKSYYVLVEFVNKPKDNTPPTVNPPSITEDSSDDKYYFSIKASKQDSETNNYLSGSKISISGYFNDASIGTTKTTDGSGTVSWDDIEILQPSIQSYNINESNPPSEYWLADNSGPIRYVFFVEA